MEFDRIQNSKVKKRTRGRQGGTVTTTTFTPEQFVKTFGKSG